MHHGFHKNMKQHNCFNIANTQRFLEQHIRMISEESCDIEDWSNDAEHSALIKKSITFYNIFK